MPAFGCHERSSFSSSYSKLALQPSLNPRTYPLRTLRDRVLSSDLPNLLRNPAARTRSLHLCLVLSSDTTNGAAGSLLNSFEN